MIDADSMLRADPGQVLIVPLEPRSRCYTVTDLGERQAEN